MLCAVCVYGHIPERSIGWWSPSLKYDHQTSSSSTLALIETTSWSESLILSSSLTLLLVSLPTSFHVFLFFLSNISFLLSNLIFYLFFLVSPSSHLYTTFSCLLLPSPLLILSFFLTVFPSNCSLLLLLRLSS